MLEEPADDRGDPDRLRQAFDAGSEHADRARLISISAPAAEAAYSSSISVGSTSELSFSRIRAVFPSAAASADLLDVLGEPRAHRERGDENLAEALRSPEPRDVVEEIGDVRGDVLVGGEEPEILVDARGRGVVVARADVDVASKAVRLPPDDEGHLRVDLEVGEPVDDVDTRLLHRARPLDVATLVEAGLQLEQADGLLPVLRTFDQRRDELRLVARPVHGRLDRDHFRVVRRRLGEGLEARRGTSRTAGGRSGRPGGSPRTHRARSSRAPSAAGRPASREGA